MMAESGGLMAKYLKDGRQGTSVYIRGELVATFDNECGGEKGVT
jgi:hypothetical protein